MQETFWKTQVWSLGWEDPLEESTATHSSILAWRIPLIEEPGRLWPIGLHRVGHDSMHACRLHYVTKNFSFICQSSAAAAKSLQSCATLCDPIDGSHQAPPSLGFSRQEHWSGLPFPSPMQESEKWKWSRSVVSDSLRQSSTILQRKWRQTVPQSPCFQEASATTLPALPHLIHSCCYLYLPL